MNALDTSVKATFFFYTDFDSDKEKKKLNILVQHPADGLQSIHSLADGSLVLSTLLDPVLKVISLQRLFPAANEFSLRFSTCTE